MLGIESNTTKFWNVVDVSDNEAVLTLYGDIVESKPVDWWTGEEVSGQYISTTEFLNDLEKIKNKPSLTIRINSGGGDVYTAMGIYTQLKSLKARKTVIIDGIAASAATLIAMAGDIIKIPAGGMFMIHDPMVFLYGYINNSAVGKMQNTLESVANAAAETYASKTGLAIKEIRKMMTEETWMTGRDAVEKGFANEVLFEDEPQVGMSKDKAFLYANNMQLSIKNYRNIPSDIPFMATDFTPKNKGNEKNNNIGGEKIMCKTIEELKQQYPDLVNQIEQASMQLGENKGITAERERIKNIEEIQVAIGDDTLVAEAKYGDKPCNASELALLSMKKQAQIGASFINNMRTDFQMSGTDGVQAKPNEGNPVDPNKSIQQQEEEAIAMIAGKGIGIGLGDKNE